MAKKVTFEEAVDIGEKCDGLDDCEKCPINKKVQILVHDSGVYLSGSMCSLIQMVKDAVEE